MIYRAATELLNMIGSIDVTKAIIQVCPHLICSGAISSSLEAAAAAARVEGEAGAVLVVERVRRRVVVRRRGRRRTASL